MLNINDPFGITESNVVLKNYPYTILEYPESTALYSVI